MDLDFNVKQILQRYADKGAFHAVNGFEDLRRAGVQGDFILSLLDLFEDESQLEEYYFNRFPLPVILDYVRRTHRYYLTKKLPEIEQSIEMLRAYYSEDHPMLVVLDAFYRSYRGNLANHIEAEEKQLLPYIDLLQQQTTGSADLFALFKASQTFSLLKFPHDDHHEHENEMSGVRSVMLKYQPPVMNQTPYRILLSQLETFDRDMMIHQLIEDRVLLPRAAQLEQNLMEELKLRSGLN